MACNSDAGHGPEIVQLNGLCPRTRKVQLIVRGLCGQDYQATTPAKADWWPYFAPSDVHVSSIRRSLDERLYGAASWHTYCDRIDLRIHWSCDGMDVTVDQVIQDVSIAWVCVVRIAK